jgi:hypothetical protein
MGRILPVHEAHICWLMHHRALILPPLIKNIPSSRHFRPLGMLRGSHHLGRSPAVRIPSPPAPAPLPPPLPLSQPPSPLLLLLPPPQMRGEEGDSGPNLKSPKPNSEPRRRISFSPPQPPLSSSFFRPPPSPYAGFQGVGAP